MFRKVAVGGRKPEVCAYELLFLTQSFTQILHLNVLYFVTDIHYAHTQHTGLGLCLVLISFLCL